MNRRTRRTGFRSFDRWETVCLLAGRPKKEEEEEEEEEEEGGRSVGREREM